MSWDSGDQAYGLPKHTAHKMLTSIWQIPRQSCPSRSRWRLCTGSSPVWESFATLLLLQSLLCFAARGDGVLLLPEPMPESGPFPHRWVQAPRAYRGACMLPCTAEQR